MKKHRLRNKFHLNGHTIGFCPELNYRSSEYQERTGCGMRDTGSGIREIPGEESLPTCKPSKTVTGFILMQSNDFLLYKIHYSQEIKIIYHSFLQETSAKAAQLRAV